MTHNEMFKKCTETKPMKSGRVEIRCKLGNFSVDSYDVDSAEREAMHYWGQYYMDGEYNQILHLEK